MNLIQTIKIDLTNNNPGRLAYSYLLTICTLIVIVVCEVFQIPAMEYSAFLVLFISKEEKISTLITCFVLLIGIILSVCLAILIYMISAGEPALRVPIMMLMVFFCMGFSQEPKLGKIAFIVGFSTTLCLIIIDAVPPYIPYMPTTEFLTRNVLWLWVAAFLPLAVVSLANLYVGANPLYLFRNEIDARLNYISHLLSCSKFIKPKLLRRFESDSLEEATNYLKMGGLYHKEFKLMENIYENMLAKIIQLLFLAGEWHRLKRTEAPKLVAACSTSLQEIALSIKNKTAIYLTPISSMDLDEIKNTKDYLLLSRIVGLVNALIKLSKPAPSSNLTQKLKRHTVAIPPIQFNQGYVRHGLKASLAVFLAYFTYNMLEWPTIRTCMITCFFVSLSTTGETNHKMILRISGALLGGILGQLIIIFIMPHITSIFGLCLVLTAPVFAACWLATSSERLSYAGLQLALALFVSLFNGYEPTIDLTLARDRVIGILLGNLIVYIIFTRVWPVEAMVKVRENLGEVIENLAQLISISHDPSKREDRYNQLVFKINEAFWQTKRALFFSHFETRQSKKQLRATKLLLRSTRELMVSLLILNEDKEMHLPLLNSEKHSYFRALSQWLLDIAAQIKSNQNIPILPPNMSVLIGHLNLAGASFNIPIGYIECYDDLNRRIKDFNNKLENAWAPELKALNTGQRMTT